MLDLSSTSISHPPEYNRGRFFLSPLLGCGAGCAFCYIYSFGLSANSGRPNSFGPHESVDWIKTHECYRPGPDGTVIAIGAWGDPFPPDEAMRAWSLDWLNSAAKLGNPVQIMSRYTLDQKTRDAVAAAARYPNQVMYSTSLSTVAYWREFERNAAPPGERLATLNALELSGVPVNLMIKPFIPGLTDYETDRIVQLMKQYGIRRCVVGEFFWDAKIKRRVDTHLARVGLTIDAHSISGARHPLDCAKTTEFEVDESQYLRSFIKSLWAQDITAFFKSACASAHALNRDLRLKERLGPSGQCVECGLCCVSGDVSSGGDMCELLEAVPKP